MSYSNQNNEQPYSSMSQIDNAVNFGYAKYIIYTMNLDGNLSYQSQRKNAFLHTSKDAIDCESAYQLNQNIEHMINNDIFNKSNFNPSCGYVYSDACREEKLALLQTTRHSHIKRMEAKSRYDDEPTATDLEYPD